MRTLTLSGWGQSANVLHDLMPESHCVDYSVFKQESEALSHIATQGAIAELVIGWSLGGQLAVRAIAAGLIAPQKLVLIATPYQFVARPERKLGMPADTFHMFRNNYAHDPARTLNKAWASILKGDIRAAAIRPHLEAQEVEPLLHKQWLSWLDHLNGFSCDTLNLAALPPTLLIHGDKDAVVFHNQSEAFAAVLPHNKLMTIEGCGHAPHWHNRALVIKAIREFIHD